ncbi:MAG: hypothetical protein Q4B50_02250 [Bacillota bacterium]|nr:hypothetical protein [Bacillota bacterium]
MFTQSKTIKVFLSLLLILSFCIFAACSTDSPEIPEEAPASESMPVQGESPAGTATQEESAPAQESPEDTLEEDEPLVDIPEDAYLLVSHADIPIHHSLESMQNWAPIIVAGYFEREVDLWNASRDPEDITKPSEKHYTAARIYRFRTEEVLKGEEIPEEISVSFAYSRKREGKIPNSYVNEQGQTVREDTEEDSYSFHTVYSFFTEPPLNQKILLFLKYEEGNTVYFSAGYPSMIALRENGSPELLSSLVQTEENQEPQPQIFQSVGGRDIYYYDSGLNPDRVTNFLEGMDLDDLLDEMDIQDEAQRERIHSIVRSGAEDE